MKIVCVGYLHGAGGAERQITMLANALADDETNEVSLIVLAQYDKRYFISDRVKVIDLSFAENKKGIKILNRFFEYKKAIENLHPDITIHYWVQSVYFMLPISKEKKGVVVYSERGDPGDSEYKGILGIVRDLSFRKVDGFVFQSEGAKQYFNKKIQSRSVVIQNPVSVPKGVYQIPQNRKNKIISIGRLHPQKNHDLLIDAFNLIAKDIGDYELEIYGDGDLKEHLENKIKQLGLERKVRIYPSTKVIFSKINESKIFVLSSDFEGMPNTLMEAMALGVPSISTDCKPGGARALINDGVNGYIVPINNPLALADKIRYVIDNYEQAEKVGRKGMEILEKNSSSNIFGNWMSFLSSLK